MYNIYVEDIMVHNVKYIWYGITFIDLKKILKENRKLKYLPLVDKHGRLLYCILNYNMQDEMLNIKHIAIKTITF